MVKVDIDAIRRLSVPERVQLVQDIWDTLLPTAKDLPLTPEQAQIVDQRLADHERDPEAAIPWQQVQARIESR
jgi:putative addiction module component (TIGR02574 family)